jgi:tyrosyl-tRNA synthetase
MDSAASDAAAYLTRNAVDALPEGGLERKLEEAARDGRQLRAKLGLDPTAADIHLGHTVVLRKLREFQDLGHKVVLIVGDFTARVGDPSGRSSTRPDDPALYELRFNSEWLDMPMEELFKLARTATVAQMLERDDFAKRFASRAPISVLELLYPLMQGYDSVAVRSDVELGGTDQTFNLLLARDVQRAYGVPEQTILTVPILPGIDGVEKMSKSLGNHIGVTETPEEMYGRTLSLPDDAMGQWFAVLGIDPPPDGTPARDAKRALARAVVERFHGAEAAGAAEEHFDRVHVRHEAPEDMPELEISGAPQHLPELLSGTLGVSRSQVRQWLAQGGVKLNGEPLPADQLDLEPDGLDGAVLQVGKRQFRRLRVRS